MNWRWSDLWPLWPVPVLLLCLAGANAATPKPPADGMRGHPPSPREHVIQIKLRDLLDAIPRKEAAEIAARLKAIEERLTAIEQKMGAPVPAPVPLGAPR